MKITYLGHASLSIEINGKNIIIDPFISENELAYMIDVDKLKADYILLTHAHGDHVADVERIGKRTGAKLVSNYEIVSYFQKKGIEGHPMNHGGKWKFDFGYVKYVNAIHSSSFPDGTYGGNPGGFVIWDDNISFYIAGDTALTEDMKIIPMSCPKLDFCVLPIGDNFTMDYKDAALAADFVQCKKVIPYHYDTFGYIVVDHNKVQEHFDSKGLTLNFLKIGESLNL